VENQISLGEKEGRKKEWGIPQRKKRNNGRGPVINDELPTSSWRDLV
jgi:hypothetical protein